MPNPTTSAVEAAMFHRAMIEPEEWAVRCPVCDHTQAVDVMQDDAGAWRGNGADQFPECEGCGALLEVVPAVVQALPAAIAARGAGGDGDE